MGLITDDNDADSRTHITSVLLLCAECQQPIKATITTAQWVKCEWISADGTCQACWQLKKREAGNAT